MEDIIYYSELFDYYGELLSDKERNYFKDYYFENLSLQEIADNYQISRNAVSKSLKSAKEKMNDYENKLKLIHKKDKIRKLVSLDIFDKIEKYL